MTALLIALHEGATDWESVIVTVAGFAFLAFIFWLVLR